MLSSLRPLPQKRYRWCNPRLAALVSVALFATTTTVALAMTGVRPSTTNTTEAFTLTAASGDFDCPFGTLEAPFNNYVVATGAPFTVPVGTLATGLTLLSGGMTVTWASPQADPAGVDAYLILEPFGDPAGFTVNAGGMSVSSAFPTKTDARGPSGFPMLEERAGAFAPRLVFFMQGQFRDCAAGNGPFGFRVGEVQAGTGHPGNRFTAENSHHNLNPTSANPHTCQLTHGRTAAALVPTTAVGPPSLPVVSRHRESVRGIGSSPAGLMPNRAQLGRPESNTTHRRKVRPSTSSGALVGREVASVARRVFERRPVRQDRQGAAARASGLGNLEIVGDVEVRARRLDVGTVPDEIAGKLERTVSGVDAVVCLNVARGFERIPPDAPASKSDQLVELSDRLAPTANWVPCAIVRLPADA